MRFAFLVLALPVLVVACGPGGSLGQDCGGFSSDCEEGLVCTQTSSHDTYACERPDYRSPFAPAPTATTHDAFPDASTSHRDAGTQDAAEPDAADPADANADGS